jgi:hypothetical protein
MTANDAFVIYKKLDDAINICQIPPQRYLGYQLKDKRKLEIFQELVDSDIDIHKFFLANCTLNKEFFIDYYKYSKDKCMTLYHSWDEILEKKRTQYFHRVIAEYKKGTKIDVNDRDKFLDILPFVDNLFLSAFAPELEELLLSLDDDWLKFNVPEFHNAMDFARHIMRGYILLKNMKSFSKLREKIQRSVV